MANEENIIAHRFKAGDEAREKGSKGGKASGEARRRKRDLKEAADYYLSLRVADKRIVNKIIRAGVAADDIDNQMAIIAALTRKAMGGDEKAAKTLFDLLGEDNRINNTTTNLLDAIAEASAREVNMDDIPEFEQTATSGHDMVEQTESEGT